VSGRVIQGWHSDPFGVHEARYFSAGQPTKLVRDGGTESYDEPPSGADEVAAAMARLSAPPAPPAPPSAYAPRDAYPYGPASERDPRRRAPGIAGFAASGIILVAAAVASVLVAQTIMHPAKPARPSGAGDVAFVTQAATRTLQQRTADVVLSASAASGSTNTALPGTGAFDLRGKAGTLNMTMGSQTGVTALRELWVNGHAYVAMSVNGQSLLPKGKEWVAEPVLSQGSGATDLTGGDPTAALASLEKQGIMVRALGTKVIGGVSCTGYSVTPLDGGGAATITVWINPQDLVREFSVNETISIMVNGAPLSPGSTGSASAPSVDVTMDFSYSAVPLHVTAPSAASTVSLDAFLQQLGQNPALKRLEPSSAS
jgi:hypothetical protein